MSILHTASHILLTTPTLFPTASYFPHLKVPALQPPRPHLPIPLHHIRQPHMRSIRILLPLRSRRLQARLLLTLLQHLRHTRPPIIAQLRRVSRALALLADFLTELGGSTLVDGEVARVDDDAVVAGCAGDGDEFLVDFAGDDCCRTSQGVAEAAAAPGYPFEDVACILISKLFFIPFGSI